MRWRIAPTGGGALEPLEVFTTTPAGSAIVDAVGPIRQIVHSDAWGERFDLVIAEGTLDQFGLIVQRQASN
jgi:hypothetical protein